MEITVSNFKSRFGYHPCDYQTYLKLKFLKKIYWQTVKDFHKWWRWNRKTKYHQGPEPTYDKLFIEDKYWTKQKMSHGVKGYRLYPKKINDYGILELFDACRKPQENPPELLSPETLKKIEDLFIGSEQCYKK